MFWRVCWGEGGTAGVFPPGELEEGPDLPLLLLWVRSCCEHGGWGGTVPRSVPGGLLGGLDTHVRGRPGTCLFGRVLPSTTRSEIPNPAVCNAGPPVEPDVQMPRPSPRFWI